MNSYGYLGIALLIAIENIFPPIPSEVILTFGGFLTTHTLLTVWGVILASTLGSYIGAIVLYLAGNLLSKDKLYKLVNGKIGKILHLKKENIDNSENWFLEKGKYSVLYCRFIPIIRSLISIPAGMTNMNFTLFSILTIIGSLIWNAVLVYLGALAGEAWQNISIYVGKFSKIILIILGITLLGYAFYKIKTKKKQFKS